MVSLLTNASSMTALQTLRSISRETAVVSTRLATGRQINTAADSGAYWAIATTMRAEVSTLGSVKSSLSVGAAVVEVAAVGLSSALKDLGALRDLLVLATSAGADRSLVQRQVAAVQDKMRTDAAAAGALGQNWLSIDSGVNNPNWERFTNFTLGVSRGDNGLTYLQSEQLDVASVALFDANIVSPHKPLVSGNLLIDPIDRLAASINQSTIGAQVTAYRGVSYGDGSGTLYLQVRDTTKTIKGSFTDGSLPPVSGTPVDLPVNQFGDPLYSYVAIPISNLSASDAITFQVSGDPTTTFAVTTEGDKLDFSGNNEIHMEVRPFREKYPDVSYDVLVNGATLAAAGITNLSNVSHWEVVEEIAKQIDAQYEVNYVNSGPRDEIYVDARTYTSSRLAFFVNASGPKSEVSVSIAAPTSGHNLISIGYGAGPGTTMSDLGFQEPDRSSKGILDTPGMVANSWRTNLAGERIPIGYTYVSIAGSGSALGIPPSTTQEQIEAFIQYVDQISANITDAASKIGSLKNLLTSHANFLDRSEKILRSAIGTVVDADIEEEAARLKALQVQRELAVQALSIANSNTQTVLSLFRN
ncbi:flagellin N-terminal helical domain-containing protein [Methylorubrum aminovorans]